MSIRKTLQKLVQESFTPSSVINLKKRRRSSAQRSNRLPESLEPRCLLSGTGYFVGGQRLGEAESFGVELGDLDGDGDLDAFLANSVEGGSELGLDPVPNTVWLNDGAGNFTDSGQTLGNEPSLHVALGDLNGDGALDAFVGNVEGNTVWLNNGSGTFADSGQSLGTADSLHVALADLDGDGDLDAAVANSLIGNGPNTAGAVWINDGTGTFSSGSGDVWRDAVGIALGDVDGDGDADAFVTRQIDTDITEAAPDQLWLNDGAGAFTLSDQQFASQETFGVALADFDNDGDLDAFAAGQDFSGPSRFYINQGGTQSGVEGQFVDSGESIGLGYANRAAVGDLNGDSLPDLFLGLSEDDFDTSAGPVLLNTSASGGSGRSFAATGQYRAPQDSIAVALGDVNGDGAIDALIGNGNGNGQPTTRVWLNQAHPVATYAVNGNVPIDVPAGDGLLAGLGSVTISNVDTSNLAGTVNVDQTTGAFDFTPATGFLGSDKFTIELSDNRTFIVAMDVYSATWFVDPTATAGGDGSLAAPFQTLDPLNDAANDVDRPNDLIYVRGSGNLEVSGANGFELEFGQSLVTSARNPFANPQFMANIDHPIAPFSSGLPMGPTGRPTFSNSTSNAPVFTVSGHNWLSDFDVDPTIASDAFLANGARGELYLTNIEFVPDAGDHSYNGLTVTNSSLGIYITGFEADTDDTSSTTSGTMFDFDNNLTLEFRLESSGVQQSGGGLLAVTNTSGEADFEFTPFTTLDIDGGDFGFLLDNNPDPETSFGFAGAFSINDVTEGITAINTGTIEIQENGFDIAREVSSVGGDALWIERTTIGDDGFILDDVNASDATHGIYLSEVSGHGIHIEDAELFGLTTTAVHVQDSPNIDLTFGRLKIQGPTVDSETAAGTGIAGNTGDGGQAVAAQLDMPVGVAVDRWGNTYIADAGAHVIRRIDRVTGVISTIAGTGTSGFSGDGGAATSAQIFYPESIVFDGEDNLYFGDKGNNRIRRIDAKTGVITTIVGSGNGDRNGGAGFGGDGGQAADAILDGPTGLVFHPLDGSLFFSDENNHRVRRVDTETGVITTVVGTGTAGSSNDGTPPSQAQLNSPKGLMFSLQSTVEATQLHIVDSGNHRTIGVSFELDDTWVEVGTGIAGNNGTASDDADTFQLNSPTDITLIPDGGLLITDSGNHRIVFIGFHTDGPLEAEVVAGNGSPGFAGDGSDVSNAEYSSPMGMAVAPDGTIYFADSGNHRLRAAEYSVNSGEGVRLEDNPGANITFAQIFVNATGEAFVADDSGIINIGDSHPNYDYWALYGPRAILNAVDGRALDVTETTLSNGRGGVAQFRHISSLRSARDGIVLDQEVGNIYVHSAYIEDPNQDGASHTAGIAIEEGAGDVTIHSTIVNTKGRAISILGRTGGDIHLVTPLHDFVSGTPAVRFQNNSAGSTTIYRPIEQAPTISNSDNHSITLLGQGEAPPAGDYEIRFTDSGQLLGNSDVEYPGVALGDLDGDGDLDAFVTAVREDDQGDLVAQPNLVFLNNNGVFTDSGQQLGSKSSFHVQLGDFDNDGDLDAFVANHGANEIWLNDGQGNFTDSGQTLGDGTSTTVALGDLDGDGDLDAVIANSVDPLDGVGGAGEVWINQGTHSGTFQNTADSLWDSLAAFGVALGDVDNDGDLDAFLSQNVDADSDRLETGARDVLLLNNSDGTFVDSGVVFPRGFGLSAVLEDFDGDGDIDIFAAGTREFPGGYSQRDPNRYYTNLGGDQGGTIGTFSDPVLIHNENQDQVRLAAGDFDNDGDLDVFVANAQDEYNHSDDGQNRVYVNMGGLQGGFEGEFIDNGQQLGSEHTPAAAVGDLNGDGLVDVFTTNSFSPNRVWLNATGVVQPIGPQLSPFRRIAPDGSLIAWSDADIGTLETNQVVELPVYLQANQTIMGFVETDGADVSFEIVRLTDRLNSGDGAGDTSISSTPQRVSETGTYTVRLENTGPATDNVGLALVLNGALDTNSSDDGTEISLDETLIQEDGVYRWGAVGSTKRGSNFTPPDTDVFTFDVPDDVRSLDAVLTVTDWDTGEPEGIERFDNATFELLNPSGVVVGTGSTGFSITNSDFVDIDLAILDHVVVTAGRYSLRVREPENFQNVDDNIPYSIVVTGNATFDVEHNLSNHQQHEFVRSLSVSENAIGYLNASIDSTDGFQIELTAGQAVTLWTETPFDPQRSPVNTLDPALEILSADGTSLATDQDSYDGTHPSLTFTPAESGTYFVRVAATAGAGEYRLKVDFGEARDGFVTIGDGAGGGPTLGENAQYGAAVANIGDLDGDGISELAVGAPVDGAVFIQFMNADGSVDRSTRIERTGHFGSSVASIGDLDNDGIPELFVGAVAGNQGHIFFLNRDGSLRAETTLKAGEDGVPGGSWVHFGSSATSLGDLDGDGIPDIAVGQGGHASRGFNHSHYGWLHILNLNADGTVKATSTIENPLRQSAARFGSAVALIGDVNGDGIDDLAVGADQQIHNNSGGCGNCNTGAVYILFMNASGGVQSHTILASQLNGIPLMDAFTRFGASVTAAGDLDGDSIPDLIVGAPFENRGDHDYGNVFVMLLKSDGSPREMVNLRDGDGRWPAATDNQHFGSGLALLGDSDNDGNIELAIGAVGDDIEAASQRGVIYIVDLPPFMAELSVSLSTATINEGDGTGAASLSVSRTDDVSESLTVLLTSSDPGEAILPASVTIPAGATTSAPILIDAVDDDTVDGTQTVVITATANGQRPGRAELLVTDNEAPGLVLVLSDSSFAEDAGENAATATVIRNSDTLNALTVNLSSSDVGEAVLLGGVTIPAGATSSAPFRVDAVDDTIIDGTQPVTITASAAGHSDGTAVINVLDNEVADISVSVNNGELTVVANTGTSKSITVRRDETVTPVQIVIGDPSNVFGTRVGTGHESHEVRIPVDTDGGIASIRVAGHNGNDHLTVDFSGGEFGIPIAWASESQAGNGDSLSVIGHTSGFDAVVYEFLNRHDGSVSLSGELTTTISYTGLGPLIADVNATDVTLHYSTTGEIITVESAPSKRTQVRSTAGETVTFRNPAGTLTIDAGDGGNDAVDIESLTEEFPADLIVRTGTGIDAVNLNGEISLADRRLIVDADTITTNEFIKTAGGDIELTASGDITLIRPVSTAGGAFSAFADSDMNGAGTFTLGEGVPERMVQAEILTSADPASSNEFGISLAATGDTALVGARNNGGAVHVFSRDNQRNWIEQTVLRPPESEETRNFGWSVALSEETAVVGTTGGPVSVFSRDSGGTWIHETELTRANAESIRFGWSVAVSGDTIMVGAHWAEDSRGTVIVFQRDNNGVWKEAAELVASDASRWDEFGYSVAIDGDTAIIGARWEDGEGIDNDPNRLQGAAYIFRRNSSGTWNEDTILRPPAALREHHFGWDVSIRGDIAVVGAPDITTNDVSGAAYVFERYSNNNWVLRETLGDSQPGTSNGRDYFGTSVAISDNRRIVVGASSPPALGQTYVYAESDTGRWEEYSVLVPESNRTTGDHFGRSVAATDGTVLVGMIGFDGATNISNQGAAVVFETLPAVPGGRVRAGSGNISVRAGDIHLAEGGINGVGDLTIAASTSTGSIGVGTATGTLSLDNSEFDLIGDAFASVTIGDRSAGYPDVTVDDTVFDRPVSIISGDTTLKAGTTFLAGIGGPEAGAGPGTHNQISASGNVSIEDGVLLNIVAIDDATGNQYIPVNGTAITLIERLGGIGEFSGIPEGTVISNFLNSGEDAVVTYAGGDGNDVVILVGEQDNSRMLTLSLSDSSIGETFESNAIIERNGAVDEPLAISLASSDVSEATVPASVTIPAGQTSVEFNVSAVDDDIVDGDVTVTISASATGYEGVESTIVIEDDDVAALTLTVSEDSVIENDGASAATGTVSRNTPTDQALVVSLSSSDTSEATIPTTVTIPAGSTFVEFAVAAINDSDTDGTQSVVFSAEASSFLAGTAAFEVQDDDQASSGIIDFENIATGEKGTDFLSGYGITSVSVSAGLPLAVIDEQGPEHSHQQNPGHGNYLGQSNPSPFSARTMTFEFEEGLTRFAFRRIGGSNRTSAPFWTATAYNSENEAIDTAGESGSGFFLLRSDRQFEIAAPEGEAIARIEFVMGRQLSTFGVVPIDDIELEFGDVPGTLTLELDAAEISEGSGTTTATVSRSGDTSAELTVTLTGSDSTELSVPQTVTIPTGQSSAQFTLTGVDDDDFDGTQTVTIDATAGGMLGASITIDVTDNEVGDAPVVLGPSGPVDSLRPEFVWTGVNGAASYEVWLERIGGESNPVINPTVNETTYLPAEDLGVGRFRLWVRASFASGGLSEWASSTFRVETEVQIAELPFHGDDLTPEISWNAVPGATGYRIYGGNLTANTIVFDDIVTETSYTPSADLGFGRHRFWVRPLGDGNFNGRWSDAANYYIGPAQINPAHATSDSTPTFAWEAMEDVASVHLYVSRGSTVIVNEGGLTETSYTVTEELEDNLYRWWIRPTHTNGRVGAWSPLGLLEIGNRPVVISPNYYATDSTVDVKWGPLAGAGSYEIYLFHDDGLGLIHRETGITATSYEYPPLPDGNYRVWIRSYTTDGQPDTWSRPYRFVLEAATSRVGVTLTGPIGSTFDEEPTFSWTADSEAASFDFYATDGSTVIEEFDLTDKSYQPIFPLAAGPIEWYVRAKTAAGEAGPWFSAEADLSARPALIQIPGPFTDPRPALFWEAVAGAVEYDVFITGENDFLIRERVASTEFFPEVDLPSGEFRVWIQALNEEGLRSPWSLVYVAEISLSASQPVGSGDLELDAVFATESEIDDVVVEVRRTWNAQDPSPREPTHVVGRVQGTTAAGVPAAHRDEDVVFAVTDWLQEV